MLTSLLPGLRELRAPLAAGYVWLLAVWIALESHVPERADSEGTVLSLYRLNDALSGFGLAAVATFTAYLLGSLSATLFSPLLRQAFRRRTRFIDTTVPSEPLSGVGLGALEKLARETRERMDDALALSSTSADELVSTVGSRRRVSVRPQRPRGGGPIAILGAPVADEPESSRDEELEGRLTRMAIDDLDAVLRTRLLGRDADLYSAIDRHRGEVEFRLAVAPPLLALGAAFVVFGWRDWQLWIPPLVGALTVLGAFGLFWDARKRQTEANDMLAEALGDRRVRSPTLEDLETAAAAIAERPEAEAMRTAAADFTRPLAQALEMADGSRSDFTRAGRAADALAIASERAAKLGERFPPRVERAAAEVLEPLTQAIELWEDALHRRREVPDWGERVTALVEEARVAEAAFRNAALAELAHRRRPVEGDADSPTEGRGT